ncbi:response regulator [Glycomyces tenuis]|uniref:response regulator n=1 Tax=Glycomyces tenuis TaxID=58116 RepID=UPI00041937F2|nr:response regulator transcription factor [Glycomyces tenuis]
MTVRVMLVDDQPLLRQAFRMILETRTDVEVVAEASDGAEAIDVAGRCRPDVVLMDVRMPVLDGIGATASIVAADPGIRVLVLTVFDNDENVYAALRAGASGFLLKNARPTELFDAVHAVHQGNAVVAPSLTRRLLDTFAAHLPDPATGVREDRRLRAMTDRERQVAIQVARGFTNAEIAERLDIAPGTVKIHIGRILAKLGLRDRVQLAILAYETGLVHRGQTHHD